MSLWLGHCLGLWRHLLWRFNLALLPLRRLQGTDNHTGDTEPDPEPMSGWKLAIVSVLVLVVSFGSFFI